MIKNVTWFTRGPTDLLDEIVSPPVVFGFLPCCGFHSKIVIFLFHINYIVSCLEVFETSWQRYNNSPFIDTAWESDHFSSQHTFFATKLGSQVTSRTQLEKVIIYRYTFLLLTGGPNWPFRRLDAPTPPLPNPPLRHLNTKVRVKEVQCLDNFLHFLCHRFFHSEADLNDLGSSHCLSFDSFKKPAASQLWTGWQCSRALRRLLRLTLIRRSGGLNNTLQLCEGGLSPVHLCCQAPGPETRHLRSFIQAQATFSLKVCLLNHPQWLIKPYIF